MHRSSAYGLIIALLVTESSTLVTERAVAAVFQPVKQAATRLLWEAKLLSERRQPMRLGVDVEVRENSKGFGLYSLRSIAAGELIARYDGPTSSWENFQASESTGAYAMLLSNGDVVDGEDEAKSSYVRFINHSVRRANSQMENAFSGEMEDGPLSAIYIQTIRDIKPGEELLFDYGPEYWDTSVGKFSPKRLAIDYL